MSEIRQVGYRSIDRGHCELTLEIDGLRATCAGRTIEDARAACVAALAIGLDPEGPAPPGFVRRINQDSDFGGMG